MTMILSPQKIGSNFSRAARIYDRCADIQSDLAQDLISSLDAIKFEAILDIGCGTGNILRELSKNGPGYKLLGLDLSLEMVDLARQNGIDALSADAACLPFKENSFDLVLSNATYQWVDDLNKAFGEVNRVLDNGGIFTFTCFGAQTLKELRQALKIEENYLPGKDKVASALEFAGFKNMDIETSIKSKYFDNLMSILFWLKKIGANNIDARPFILTRNKLEAADRFYSDNFKDNSKVLASFEVIKVKCQKQSL